MSLRGHGAVAQWRKPDRWGSGAAKNPCFGPPQHFQWRSSGANPHKGRGMNPGQQDTSGTAMAIQGLVQSVDQVTDALERKWGVGRLRLLVGDGLRERFDRQWAKWQAAYAAQDLEAVRAHSEAMRRAWAALEQAAIAAGHQILATEVWETRMPNGRVLGIVRSLPEAHALAGDGRERDIWTLDEVGRVLTAWDAYRWVEASHAHFPGAQITALRLTPRGSEFDWKLGDEIPFGHGLCDSHAHTPITTRATP